MYNSDVIDLKVVLVGDSSVGKSSLVMRYVNGTFQNYLDTTIGGSFQSRTVSVDRVPIRMQIWDTAGTEKYRAMTSMYYREASAVVLVFSLVEPASLDGLSFWVEELKKSLDLSRCAVCVVGNKADLCSPGDQTVGELRTKSTNFSTEHDFLYLETSAKTGGGVDEMFMAVAKECARKEREKQEKAQDEKEPIDPESLIDITVSDNEGKKKCC